LIGCAASGPEAPTDATPSEGGTLRVAIDADPVCLDPAQATLIASSVVARQIVDSLIEQDPETGEFVPWLADSFEANDDATAFTFVLRDGVTFSDGTAVDATAVKTFFDGVVALGPKALYGSAYLKGYTGTDVVDDSTVTVNFSAPNAQFLMGVSTTSLGLQSPESMAVDPAEKCLGTGIIATGPFMIDSYEQNQSVGLVVREDYDWPSAIATHEGRAFFDAVDYTIATEPSVRSGSLTSGQVDLATTISPQDEPLIDGNGFSLLTRTNPGVVIGMSPDMTNSTILQDDDVRKAIQLGIDRDEISEVVLTPSYGVAKSVLGDTTPGFTDFTDDLGVDAEAAADLLDGAGWELGSDGIREKDGQKLSLTIAYFYQANVVEYVQQQLRKIGVDLVLKEMTAAQYAAEYRTGNYDFISTSISRPDPDILRAQYSMSAGNTAFLTPENAGVAELEELFTTGLSTTDRDARYAAADEAQQLLLENDYMFPFSQLTQVIGVSDKVTGTRYDASSRFVLYDAAFTE
jgi:peptide/nickel transport system substrate-binding protein